MQVNFCFKFRGCMLIKMVVIVMMIKMAMKTER